MEPTVTRSTTSYSTDVVRSCRREPPPDELGDAEEPRATSALQQDYPEVVGLGVTVSEVVELGDTRPEVVDLGVGEFGGAVLGVAVSEVWNLVLLCPKCWSSVVRSLRS